MNKKDSKGATLQKTFKKQGDRAVKLPSIKHYVENSSLQTHLDEEAKIFQNSKLFSKATH